MAYIHYDKLWRSVFYYNVTGTDRMQDVNLNQLKLKVNDTYKKDEEITRKLEADNDEGVKNKS